MTEGKNNKTVRNERERWSSKLAFYFAAVGSAVGFGNIWRFPSLVYSFGGGVFFIPYFLALVFIGLPILILEIGLGQYYESGDVEVFGGIHHRLRGVGLSSIGCGYMLVTYYSMLISWVVHAFIDTFGSTTVFGEAGVTGTEASEYFMDSIVGMETVGDDMKPTRLVWKNVGYSFLVWAVIYCCVAFGVKVTGRLTYVTMGLPVIFLFCLLGRTVTLDGASDGISAYLRSDWSVLVEQPEVWVKACAQIFYSLSVCFGIMSAYASHCNRDESVIRSSVVIAGANSMFSFISGFAVFSTLGYLANIEGKEISQLDFSSFGLVFGSYPVALGTLPGGIHWIRLFFAMLFLLGIDSAFSFMDGFLVCLNDSAYLSGFNPKKTAFAISFVAWLFSLLYATDSGLYFLDTIDYYIQFVMLLVGAFHCFAAGWIYNIEEQVDNLGAPIVFSFMATYGGSFLGACVIWFSVSDPANALWAGFVGLVLFFSVGMAYVSFLIKMNMDQSGLWSWRLAFNDLMFRNIIDLRDDLSMVVGHIPLIWAVLIKFVIPPVLLVLFSLGCAAKTSSGETEFGRYGNYPTLPYQLLGVLTVIFVGFLFFSAVVMPRIYSGFQKTNSPLPSKDTTIVITRMTKNSDEPAELDTSDESSVRPGILIDSHSVWPPRTVDIQV